MRKKTLIAGSIYCLWFSLSNPANADSFSEVFIGYAIAPVPLELANKNFVERYRIGLGSYLVNGPMACAGCHTTPSLFAPGGDPFQGQPTVINTAAYLGGGTAFGPFIARNLTPDKRNRPAGLTFAQFKQVMRQGTDFKANPPSFPGDPPLLQVMPWPEYKHTTIESLQAIYEYLSVIPCLEGGPGQTPNRCGR